MAPGRMVPSFGLKPNKPNRPTAAKTGFGGKTGPGARTGLGGQGLGKEPLRRHRKLPRDTIRGITKGDIRRMARRGGVKRISSTIYDDARAAMTDRLKVILQDCVVFLEHSRRKTVTVSDVIFALKRLGRPIYGFDNTK